jgi:hypothetical protein
MADPLFDAISPLAAAVSCGVGSAVSGSGSSGLSDQDPSDKVSVVPLSDAVAISAGVSAHALDRGSNKPEAASIMNASDSAEAAIRIERIRTPAFPNWSDISVKKKNKPSSISNLRGRPATSKPSDTSGFGEASERSLTNMFASCTSRVSAIFTFAPHVRMLTDGLASPDSPSPLRGLNL